MTWVVGALLVVAGVVVPVLVAERLEAGVHEWLLRRGRNRALRTVGVLLGLFAVLGAVLALAGLAAYRIDGTTGGAVLLVVAVPLLCVAMVFSPSSWNAPRVSEETAAFRARGASRATATTVFWLGFVGLVALFGASAGMALDLWLL
ncbi:hypothetical protein [Nocardioides marmoraquaticus]